jgi:hypothetical protein
MYHHTNVDTKDFNFNNFQRGNKQVSQFGDGLNASSNTTSFLVSRYGKPIQGEVNDADFVKIDASKTEKEVYEELKKQGYIFSEVHDTNDVLSEVPGAAMELFTDFQKSNPNVKGVRVSNHIIGNTKVAPFYVIYDAKSFYGQGALSKKIEQESNAELAALESKPKINLEAKKADIERRRQEVERLSNKELTSPTGKINTGKIEIPILPSQNIDKTIYKDNKGVEYKVKANFKNLQDVLLGRNGKYLFRGMQGRFFVLAKVGDFYLPFYISSAGTSGKKQGEWYPFFGYTGNWLVKGRVGNKGEMEYSQKISEVQKLLQENLQFSSRFLNLKGEMKVGDNVIYDINQDFNYIEHFTTFGDGTVKREGDK